jgi:hypothetical protein
MSINQVLNGQIQMSQSNNTLTTTQTTAQTTTGQKVSSVNISPVSNTIDPSLYVYDGQTTLYINSTVNQTNNSVRLKYFDQVTGYPNLPGGMGGLTPNFSNWNFDLTPQNYLNGYVTCSNLLGEETSMYDNLQPPFSTPNYVGIYSLDITDGIKQNDSSGNSTETLFFSLTAQPYLSYEGKMYSSPGEFDVSGSPSPQNINPNYTTLGTDTYLFTSQYWVQTNNEILLIYMIFSVANTSSTYYSDSSSPNTNQPAPVITVNIYNKVISKEMLASIGTGNSCPKAKVYSSGVINLRYLQTGQTFLSDTPSYFLFNNIPIILADGFGKQFATFGLYYIPPGQGSVGQYLVAGNGGFTIQNFLPIANIATTGATPGIKHVSNSFTQFGHFVVSVSYSFSASQYSPGISFVAQVLFKNIWRSPIAIYSSYSEYSVNDLTNKQVVLLFGKTSNGGTFLVTNTGTPLAQITNYSITSLGNFMTIMKTLLVNYSNTNTNTLADYFINTTLINILNTNQGINIIPMTLQPVLEGTIINPSSILNCPNMWYMFINTINSVNLSVDPTYQKVFNSDSSLYFGIQSSYLCDTGLCRYFNSELLMIGTDKNNNNTKYYFGNSLYMGLNVINGQSYYMLLILPEALFNGLPLSTSNNVISIYSVEDSVFYFIINANTSSAFVPTSNTITNSIPSSSSTVSGTVNSSYNISKVILPVSNVQLM